MHTGEAEGVLHLGGVRSVALIEGIFRVRPIRSSIAPFSVAGKNLVAAGSCPPIPGDCNGTTIENKILTSGLPEQLQDFSDLLVYPLGVGKLKRKHGGVEEGGDSVFLYRTTLGQLAFKISVGTAKNKNKESLTS